MKCIKTISCALCLILNNAYAQDVICPKKLNCELANNNIECYYANNPSQNVNDEWTVQQRLRGTTNKDILLPEIDILEAKVNRINYKSKYNYVLSCSYRFGTISIYQKVTKLSGKGWTNQDIIFPGTKGCYLLQNAVEPIFTTISTLTPKDCIGIK